MDLQNAPLSEPPTDDAPASAAVPHWARARIEGQQAMLDEVGRMAFNILKAIEGEALAMKAERDAANQQDAVEQNASGEAPLAPAAERKKLLDDLGLTFSRVTRVLRLTFILQSKLTEQLERLTGIEHCEARDAGRPVAEENARKAKVRTFERKARVQLVIERIAQGEHPGDGETVEGLVNEACERMRDSDRFGDILRRPVSEIIDLICRDLGLSPDWPSLFMTSWAQEEIHSGKIGEPLAEVRRSRSAAASSQAQATGPIISDDGSTFTFVIPPLPPRPSPRAGRVARRPAP